MGSSRDITRGEAASILGKSLSFVSNLTRKGLLRVTHRTFEDGHTRYDREEILAYKEALDAGDDFLSIAAIARQAWAAARASQRRIHELERLIGLSSSANLLDDAHLLQRHESVRSMLTQHTTGAQRINEGADILASVCDEYLLRVQALTAELEPWRIYLDLGKRLARSADPTEPDTMFALKRLHLAQTSLRHSIYAYALQKHGAHNASRLFPDDFQGEEYTIARLAVEASKQ